MPEWMAILLLIFALWLPGRLIVQWLAPAGLIDAQTGRRAYLELIFASLAAGMMVVGWAAFVLAELGWFSIERLGFIWLVVVLGLGLMVRRRRLGQGRQPVDPQKASFSGPLLPHFPLFSLVPSWVEGILLGVWLLGAVWLFFRPHEYILGGADAGVYVSLGAEIAQNGRILIADTFLANLDQELYPVVLRSLPPDSFAPDYLLPAFYVMGEPAGQLTPQFYHLHPVWLAIMYGLTDSVTAELMLSGLWAILGSLAIYFTVRQVAGWQTAVLVLLGMSGNALQIWFARYPTTEMLTQYLLWTGLWGVAAWFSGRPSQPLWALLAGGALGRLFLVRIDTLFLLPIFGLLIGWLWLQGRWRRDYWYFVIPFTFFVGHSLVHALWQSRPYFLDLFGFTVLLVQVYWGFLSGGLLAGLLVLGGMVRFRHRVAFSAYTKPVLIAAVGALVLLAGYAWFIRPYVGADLVWDDPYSASQVPQLNRDNLWRLGWYLSPVGVWLGVAGMCLLIWRVNRQTAVLIAVGLFFSIFYVWNIRANPHQVYAMRRFVPMVMPFFVVAAAYFIGWMAQQKKPMGAGVALVLAAAWLSGLLWSAQSFVGQVDHQGLTGQLADIEAQLSPQAVLIFNDQSPVGLGDFWGTPLKFIYGHDVLTLRNLDVLDEALLVETIEKWQNNGREVYWIGAPDWLTQQGFGYQQINHTLTTQYLERVYEKKPQVILTDEWILPIAHLEK